MLDRPVCRSVAPALAVALLAAACGGAGDSADAEPDSTGDAAVSTDVPQSAPATDAPTTPAPDSTEVASTEVPTDPSESDAVDDSRGGDVVVGNWQRVDGGDDCRCADGSEVRYLQRVADPEKVVLYFEGGGACFTAETCAFGGESSTYVSSSDVRPKDLAQRGGVFDAENPANPLAEYSFVYVPYCTGDVHVGNTTTQYSEDVTVHHNGYVNALAALEHLTKTFPETTELVVTGASAGGIPAPLFGGLAADELPDARIVSFSDSSGAYPDEPALNSAIGALWGTTNAIPDWPETQDVTAEEWSIPGLYTYSGAHAPDVTFAKFDYAYDEVQAFFGGLAGVPGDELLTLIDQIESDIEATGVDVASYIAPGTAHTILGGDEFYELSVEGVRFVDWLTDLVTGSTPADVRCATCR